jgi:DNA integrity scanning protein DisA with diadenylate cyclase activity
MEHEILRETDRSVFGEKVLILIQNIQVSYRVAKEVADLLTELGPSGRLLSLELDDLTRNLLSARKEAAESYYGLSRSESPQEFLEILDNIDATELLDISVLAGVLDIKTGGVDLQEKSGFK